MKYDYRFIAIERDWKGTPKENTVNLISSMGKDGWRFRDILSVEKAIELGYSTSVLVFEKAY